MSVAFEVRTLDELVIDDEPSFRHVGLYADLKEVLRRDTYAFRLLPREHAGRWDEALALNLTFWGTDGGGDVLVDDHIPADVVAHAAWHHLAARALHRGRPPGKDALFLGESIASAFDVYLVGRLLGHAPTSTFLETQVPAMADAAAEAGLSARGFEKLLADLAKRPEHAFESLRQLLYDTTRALFACDSAADALLVFADADAHPMGALLHRHEISNWVLYARAYASKTKDDPKAASVDGALRSAADPVGWLTREWVRRADD